MLIGRLGSRISPPVETHTTPRDQHPYPLSVGAPVKKRRWPNRATPTRGPEDHERDTPARSPGRLIYSRYILLVKVCCRRHTERSDPSMAMRCINRAQCQESPITRNPVYISRCAVLRRSPGDWKFNNWGNGVNFRANKMIILPSITTIHLMTYGDRQEEIFSLQMKS